jgi:hypothetical protein
MPIIHFKGAILPEIFEISTSNLRPVIWTDKGKNLSMSFQINIDKSKVSIDCSLSREIAPAELSTPLVRAIDVCRGVVNCLAFARGLGLTVNIEKYIDQHGIEHPVTFKNPSLVNLATSFNFGSGKMITTNFEEMYTLVVGEPALSMALDELIVAIAIPHHITINCARAIEGLRVLCIADNIPRSKGWPILRENLRISQDYLEFITEHSRANRHGERTSPSPDVLQEILERSWTIMDRFLAFRKSGSQPLPLSKFSLL